jgi:phosphoesterase RecJ-like protein
MAYEYFVTVGYEISPVVAEYLYTAILTDTGRFRYANTTARTMEIAGRLIEAGADTQRICDLIYYDLPPTTTMLVGRVLNEVEFFDQGRICLLTLTRRMLEETGADRSETEGLVDFTMVNRGVLAGALISEIDDQATKVSLRSKNHINVARLAATFGGGGHVNAAGCTVPLPLPQAKAEVLRLLVENGHG